MKLSPTFLAIGLCLTSLAVTAQIEFPLNHPSDRIIDNADDIQGFIDYSKRYASDDELNRMQLFDNEDLRDDLRDMQNILRLYGKNNARDAFDVLAPYAEAAKNFEDLLSHLRDYEYFSVYADNDAVRASYKQKLEEHRAAYRTFIKTSDFFKSKNSLMTQLKAEMKKFPWLSLSQDRDFLLYRVAKEMKDYDEKVYDMRLLEEGIHELRRDARRLNYFNYGLEGLITSTYDRACPLGQPVTKEKPKPQTSYRCQISACLTDKLDEASGNLSGLKGDGYYYLLDGREVPDSIYQQAVRIHDDLKNSDVFLHLEEQIEGCQSEKFEEDKKEEKAAKKEKVAEEKKPINGIAK